MGPVVDYLGSPLGRSLLTEIDAQTAAAPDHMPGVHTVTAQLVDGALADLVGGDFGDKGGVHAVVGQRYGHVGLAARVAGLEFPALHQP